jgi:hypothetical protein
MPSHPKALQFEADFLRWLGAFHGAWSSLEQTVNYAIGYFLKLPHEQTHLLTSGTMFGRKATLLAGLIARSDHPHKAILQGELNHARGQVKRDWLSHAYLVSTPTAVTFIHRNVSGEYKVNKLTFTLEEFKAHVITMIDSGTRFQDALGVTPDGIADFVNACDRAVNKAKTSP